MFITNFSPDYHIGNQLRPTDSDEIKRLVQIFYVGENGFRITHMILMIFYLVTK